MGDKKTDNNDINFNDKAIQSILALAKKKENKKKTTKKKTKAPGVKIVGMGQLGKFRRASKKNNIA